MKIAFIVSANQDTGYGHYHRCRALAFELVARGHTVYFVSDIQPRVPGVRHYSAWTETDILYQLNNILPHWVIVDVPGDTPQWVFTGKWQVCAIDGVGHPASQADLVVSQGFEGEYCAPEYLMLRPELLLVEPSNRQRDWLVFGGGFDEMNLCGRFAETMKDQSAMLVASRLNKPYTSQKHVVNFITADAHIMSIYGTGKKACVAMGMSVWELLYLKVPVWVFSKTERHLETAKQMCDWLHHWPEVGLPSDKDFVEFLSLPNPVGECPIDMRGAKRVAELIK